MIGGLGQIFGTMLYALVPFAHDNVSFAAIMLLDNFGIAMAGVTLIAYMSSLTSLGYTATQYAVLTSALAWAGKTMKGFSGLAVESLQQGRDLMHAYALFYGGVAMLGLPALLLCFVLARVANRRARELAEAVVGG
jgi:PAT family beta-lactamase induction signal transducer AmpG